MTSAPTEVRDRNVAQLPSPSDSAMRGSRRRVRVMTGSLSLILFVGAIVVLGMGDYPLSPWQVLRALAGSAEDEFATTVVTQWRAPRVVAALAFGAALGIAGALFQTLTRNPLGSPDIIGFTTGSYTGVLIGMTVVGTATIAVPLWALLGGLATAAVVYGLAYRGGLQGFRFIIVGIGATAMLSSFNTWLLLRAQTEVAMAASIWGAGSLSLASWSEAAPALVMVVLLAPVVAVLARPLRQLELGDDSARAHGLRVEPTRLAVVLLAVGLTAAVTAGAGPIAFVALAAPQIAHRLTRSAGLPLLASALVGALIVLLADLVAAHALPHALPVGAVTVMVGGIYLIGLLIQQARRRP